MSQKICSECKKVFVPNKGKWNQKYCGITCQRETTKKKRPINALGYQCSPSTFGASLELIVCHRLMLEGWNVFRAISPNGPFDLVACKERKKTRRIEVRAGYRNTDGMLVYPKLVRPGKRPTEIAVVLVPEFEIVYVLI